LRIDNHGNAAMPDSHPDCRWLLTQIAALQLKKTREHLGADDHLLIIGGCAAASPVVIVYSPEFVENSLGYPTTLAYAPMPHLAL
jgi:hypothetical protein